ncbi:MAG: DUF969 domain-containing protein [Bulleidia sp.]
MAFLRLIGIFIVVIGFALRWDTIATVIAAGIATGLVAVMNGQMTFIQIFETLGSSYLTNRTATLFALTVGVIGICERYGLRDKAKDFIRKMKNLSVGGLLSVWTVIRTLSAAFSLRLGGHVQFIRPIILPMAEGAVANKYGDKALDDEKAEDKLKGLAAATENMGNFFGQNCFMGASGTLLIVNTLVTQNIEVDAFDIAMASWPIAIVCMVVCAVYFFFYDKKLNSYFGKKA